MNVEVYQEQINRRYGTRFNMPVTYYSQLLTVAYGSSVSDAGLDGQIIRARKLEDIASS
jgi:heterodisulfide reductase subunit B